MKIPVPPLDEDGSLWLDAYDVAADIVTGICGRCCVCDQLTMTYWRAPSDAHHPLHRRCAGKLITRWTEMVADGRAEPVEVRALTGAYARRAAALGAPTAVIGAPMSKPSGSPYWRPGMAENTPWVVVEVTTVGVRVLPGSGEQDGRAALAMLAAMDEQGVRDPQGIQVAGARLLDPCGNVAAQWGRSTPWEPLERAQAVVSCAVCGVEVRPGQWLARSLRACRACTELAETDDPRPSWPRGG